MMLLPGKWHQDRSLSHILRFLQLVLFISKSLLLYFNLFLNYLKLRERLGTECFKGGGRVTSFLLSIYLPPLGTPENLLNIIQVNNLVSVQLTKLMQYNHFLFKFFNYFLLLLQNKKKTETNSIGLQNRKHQITRKFRSM